ncbi:hypothetical protein CBM2633_A30018 [Cupriavidus taiwanensis]|uniref:Uncharacterized protein n=1 Tax=Cupriavidus taiwanensis TaxID=164546 RepID=A0A375E2P3_9BURK|nr:hypothetical protein CBM2615_A50040 [Cupriavidus taiwanensis]SOZ63012.1 hypothetical protein CBM2613_A40039 [Cupriavidus taiwanensis]SPA13138.1 hypothetical protein CBM2633_A30018 [Cupriavidus taiwanensis]
MGVVLSLLRGGRNQEPCERRLGLWPEGRVPEGLEAWSC